jgi:thiol-disulfide isomerase/thioredoxin
LKVVGFAGIMNDLLSKSKPGTRIADIKVSGHKVTWKGEKPYRRSLKKLRSDRNVIIFYTEGCNICEAEKKAARDLVGADKDVTVLMVNVDDIMRTDPSLASRLFDTFDLSSLPYIIETNRKGLIQRRYTSLVVR